MIKEIDGNDIIYWLLVSDVEELKTLLHSLGIMKICISPKLSLNKIQTEKESINVKLLSKENFLLLIEEGSSILHFMSC